jgi:4-amino-4-deoxy-L-arabinose transferase-like glycosyltransferase
MRFAVCAYLLQKVPSFSQWGINEAGVIARSLLLSHTYAAPFHDSHGPSSWLAPIYPLIVAGVFAVFGIQTYASALAIIVVNAACSSLVAVLLYRIGSEFFSEPAGFAAAMLWALSPAVAFMPLINWDTCVSTLLATCAVLLTLRLAAAGASPRNTRFAAAGAMWGLGALSTPVLLAPLPFLTLWLGWRGKRWKPSTVFALAACLALLPWTTRNLLVFHKFIPVRSNFWAEMSYGNLGFKNHATGNSMEFQTLGEMRFVAVSRERVLTYVRSHPGEFLKQSLHRAGEFWILPEGMWKLSFWLSLLTLTGVCRLAWRRHPAAPMLVIIFLTYPVVYYISFVFSRYRHPIEPLMYLSSATVLVEAGKHWRGKQRLRSVTES